LQHRELKIMVYEHSQSGRAIVSVLVISGLIVMAVSGLVVAATGSLIGLVGLVSVPILIVVGYLFGSMYVRVDDHLLSWQFGPGLWKKTIALNEVVAIAPAQFTWWYGYGIRATPKGWLYRVSGDDAVGVTLRSGKTVFIGTDEPDRLVAALQRRGAGV
jgi:hypothetical protein